MRKQVIAGPAFAAAVMFSTVALAADPPAPVFAEPAPPPAPMTILYDWSGFYVGGHIGYNWERKKIHYPGFEEEIRIENGSPFDFRVTSDPRHVGIDADGFNAGIQIGANWQFSQWVVGVEGDWSWSDAKGSTVAPARSEWEVLSGISLVGDTGEDIFPVTHNQRIKWFATARARLGWAYDNILLYGTGGFAWKRSQVTFSGTVPPQDGFWGSRRFVARDAKTHTGWTIGLGAEVGVTESVSIKGEWLYMDFGTKTYNLSVPFADDNIVVATKVKLTEHVVRVGLNYRFVTAPPAPMPIAAKY